MWSATMTTILPLTRWGGDEHRFYVEIDRDLSRKRVGPLALARLYGESRIFTVNFVWYSLGRNDEGDSFEESNFRRIFGRKDLLLI